MCGATVTATSDIDMKDSRPAVNPNASLRALSTLVLSALLLLPCTALAQTYTVPDGPLPNDCSASGDTVTCTDDVELEGNESLAVDGFVEWVIDGDFAIADDAKVNEGGSASDLQMSVAGAFEVEGRGALSANVDADGQVSIADDGVVDGSVSSGGEVELEGRANVTGNVDTRGEFAAADDTVIGGDVDAGGEAALEGRADIGGDLTSDSAVEIADDASTNGDVLSADNLSLSDRGEIGGGAESGNALTVEDDAAIRGGASAGSTATLEGRGLIEGDLDAADTTELADDSQITGDVLSGGTVTLEDNSAVTGCISAPEIDSNGNIGCASDLTLLASETQVQVGDAVTLGVAAQNCDNGDSEDADRWRDTWSSVPGDIDLSPEEETSEVSVCERLPQRSVTFSQAGPYDVTFTSEFCAASGEGKGNNCNNFPGGQTEIFGEDTVTITVNQPTAAATQLDFEQQPSDTAAEALIDPPVTVRAEDDDGNLVDTFTDDVTIAIDDNPAGGALSGTTTVAAEGGVATFDDLSIDEVGDPYTLEARADDLDPVTSDEFAITQPPAEGSLVAEYRMEELGWDGTTGEVSDASGTGNDGTAQNGANTGVETP